MTKFDDVKRALRGAALTAAILVAGATGADAQTEECKKTAVADPPGEVLECRGGLVIRAEQGSLYRVIDANRDGRPEEVELGSKGLMIELPPSSGRSPFQVRTPHAIASVRGTVWAVDVTPDGTSVFVKRGAVGVERTSSSRGGVTLRAGEGVDVEEGGSALKAIPWPKERADALLARFGQ